VAPNSTRRAASRGSAASSGYWQAITPSDVAGASGVALPMNSAHFKGYASGCVPSADHPLAEASWMVMTTPGDPLNGTESSALV
jgi:hypothetical protein